MISRPESRANISGQTTVVPTSKRHGYHFKMFLQEKKILQEKNFKSTHTHTYILQCFQINDFYSLVFSSNTGLMCGRLSYSKVVATIFSISPALLHVSLPLPHRGRISLLSLECELALVT